MRFVSPETISEKISRISRYREATQVGSEHERLLDSLKVVGREVVIIFDGYMTKGDS